MKVTWRLDEGGMCALHRGRKLEEGVVLGEPMIWSMARGRLRALGSPATGVLSWQSWRVEAGWLVLSFPVVQRLDFPHDVVSERGGRQAGLTEINQNGKTSCTGYMTYGTRFFMQNQVEWNVRMHKGGKYKDTM
jgi:hypothetical protein